MFKYRSTEEVSHIHLFFFLFGWGFNLLYLGLLCLFLFSFFGGLFNGGSCNLSSFKFLDLVSKYTHKYPDSKERAAIFLKALEIRRGMVAAVGIPAANESAAKFLTPLENLFKRVVGSRLRTS